MGYSKYENMRYTTERDRKGEIKKKDKEKCK
jgi:hypothetical protein